MQARILCWHSQYKFLGHTQPNLRKIVTLNHDASLVWLLVHLYQPCPITLPYGATWFALPDSCYHPPLLHSFSHSFPHSFPRACLCYKMESNLPDVEVIPCKELWGQGVLPTLGLRSSLRSQINRKEEGRTLLVMWACRGDWELRLLCSTFRETIFKPYFWQDMKNIILVQEKILFSSFAQNDSALPEQLSLVLSTAT